MTVGTKYFAEKVDASKARSPREARVIAVCNAASIEAVKTFNKYHCSMSREDVEDAKQDAILAALTYVDPEKEGAISYGKRCGMTMAIKASKERMSRSRDLRMDVLSSEMLIPVEAEISKRYNVTGADSLACRHDSAVLCGIIRQSLDSLPAADRELAELRMKAGEMSYGEVGTVLGCNESAARKRMFKMRGRLNGLMESNNYHRV